MTTYEREKEVKLQNRHISLNQVFMALDEITEDYQIGFVAGEVDDAFWTLPQYKRGFARIRTNHGHPQLSIKVEDKGIFEDRIEENSDLMVDFDVAVKQKTLELGTEPKFLKKRHFTFFIDSFKTSICCYSVDKSDAVFIEIESPKSGFIDYWELYITKHFSKNFGVTFERSVGSLYSMFIEKK